MAVRCMQKAANHELRGQVIEIERSDNALGTVIPCEGVRRFHQAYTQVKNERQQELRAEGFDGNRVSLLGRAAERVRRDSPTEAETTNAERTGLD